MSEEIFELQHWEAWEIPGTEGRPASLRITTDVAMPFKDGELLQVYLGKEGLEFHAPESHVTLILTPRVGVELGEIFDSSIKYFLPLVLTEIDFSAKAQKHWLAAPIKARTAVI